jgi:hypothetical protein
MKKPEQLAILTEACQHPLGVVVETNDPNRLRQRLYAMRRAHPEFAHLSFVVPAGDKGTELFIIARTGDDNVQS